MNMDIRQYRGLLITLFHLATIALSFVLAVWIYFDFSVERIDGDLLLTALAAVVPIKAVAFFVGGLDRGWWRYSGLTDLARLCLVNVGAGILSPVGAVILGLQFPRAVYVIDFLICFLLCAAARFSVRIYNETLKSEFATARKGLLIYGAGAAGWTLAREIRTNRALGFHIVGFIDDNALLRSSRIMDIPVLGVGRDIPRIVERHRRRIPSIDEIVIAMPSATGRQMREVLANCRASGVPCKTIPGIGSLLNRDYLTSQLRDLSVDDLLGREQIRLDERRIQESISGRSILITGAAGSIGSELCRQVARFFPGRLVLLDHAESDLFEIDQHLRQTHPDLEIIPAVGDIRDTEAVEELLRKHAVDSIYHAAAYKHVPMMERHVIEVVRNNVVGTWNLVHAARRCRVSNFLMISSDKAVNPTSVMGATKRASELIVAAVSLACKHDTSFVSVRFGNVLGSNGSVVLRFQAQIAAGGPVTVTHPEMRRYFMSIREAVLLVLQASTMGKGAEIFVLDMGEPVKIVDLAHHMIELVGLVPGDDIEVRFTGLRPGEKLFEEIALDGENVLPTYHEKIRIFKGQPSDWHLLEEWLTHLQLILARRDPERILRHLSALVPEYEPQITADSQPGAKTAVAGPETSGLRVGAAGSAR